jgi:predicted nucleic-acid-binding Zn-ribbon protein
MDKYNCPKCGSLDTELKKTGNLINSGDKKVNVLNVIDQLHCNSCHNISEAPLNATIDKLFKK